MNGIDYSILTNDDSTVYQVVITSPAPMNEEHLMGTLTVILEEYLEKLERKKEELF